MPSRPNAVLSALVLRFGADFDGELTREEINLVGKLGTILNESRQYGFEVDSDEEMVMDNDDEDKPWNFDDEILPPSKYEGLVEKDEIVFGDRKIELGLVKKAIEYYRSPKNGERSFSSLNARHRFIKSYHHLKKLKQVEEELKNGDFRIARLSGLKKLAADFLDEIKQHDDDGRVMNDLFFQQMALRINAEKHYVKDFKASLSWVANFKKTRNIGSRHITKFVSTKNAVNMDELKKQSEEFVRNVKNVIATENIPLENVWNSDQSGIQKNLVSNRTLTFLGVKNVERVVNSVAATTHSFTVMPTITASGELLDQLYTVLPESTGHFPKIKPIFQAPNLYTSANKTHIMSKDLMGVWLENCIIKNMPNKVLLLVDSWSSFKDSAYIQSKVPQNKKLIVMNIPPGTTSMIQPLDLYFFQQFKKFIKYITSYAYLHNLSWIPQQRDSILKMVSAVFRQFQAARFTDYRKFSWHRGGYIDRPADFVTPPKYCLTFDASLKCVKMGCQDYGCVKCAWCEDVICFNHFVVDPHLVC